MLSSQEENIIYHLQVSSLWTGQLERQLGKIVG